jgi:LacI family transcriptional regulator
VALRSGRSFTIGVVVPAADRSFFSKIIRGIEDEVVQAGYSVIVCQTYEQYENERRAIAALVRAQVDGVIASLAKGSPSFEHYRQLKEERIPLVLFDNTVDSLGVSTVTINDYLGAYLAVEHLIKRGRRRIAHFMGGRRLMIYQERQRGYRAALEDSGLPFDEELVLECPSDVDRGRECAQRLLELDQWPDAIFSSSDYAALGAMQWLKKRNVPIPGKIAIVGFSNEPFTSFVEPALTTVDQHSKRMGQFAARVFLEEIRHKEEHIPKQTILQPELIVREST